MQPIDDLKFNCISTKGMFMPDLLQTTAESHEYINQLLPLVQDEKYRTVLQVLCFIAFVKISAVLFTKARGFYGTRGERKMQHEQESNASKLKNLDEYDDRCATIIMGFEGVNRELAAVYREKELKQHALEAENKALLAALSSVDRELFEQESKRDVAKEERLAKGSQKTSLVAVNTVQSESLTALSSSGDEEKKSSPVGFFGFISTAIYSASGIFSSSMLPSIFYKPIPKKTMQFESDQLDEMLEEYQQEITAGEESIARAIVVITQAEEGHKKCAAT